jgi:hypothetical protein
MPTGGGGKNNGEFSGTACIGGLVKFCDVGQAFSQPGSASASMPWHHRSRSICRRESACLLQRSDHGGVYSIALGDISLRLARL